MLRLTEVINISPKSISMAPRNTGDEENLLRGQRWFHDLWLLFVGLDPALRISDLLQFRDGHFPENHKSIRKRF